MRLGRRTDNPFCCSIIIRFGRCSGGRLETRMAKVGPQSGIETKDDFCSLMRGSNLVYLAKCENVKTVTIEQKSSSQLELRSC